MRRMRHRIATIGLLALLLAAPASGIAGTRSHDGFNDEYVFATTRSVTNMDMNPALKVTIIPVTVVLDTVFLPFALIAGAVT